MKFKTFLLTEIVFLLLVIPTLYIESIYPFTFVLLALVLFPFVFLISKITHKKEPIQDVPVVVPEPAKEPVKEPEPIWKYLYLVKEDQRLGNKFERWYKEQLVENPEYFRSNAELKDYYYEEKVYQYNPFELPFKIEDNKVYSYMKENEWICVGTVKDADRLMLENSLIQRLYLLPNKYRHVGDNYVQKESGDTYFGLKILVPNKQ